MRSSALSSTRARESIGHALAAVADLPRYRCRLIELPPPAGRARASAPRARKRLKVGDAVKMEARFSIERLIFVVK